MWHTECAKSQKITLQSKLYPLLKEILLIKSNKTTAVQTQNNQDNLKQLRYPDKCPGNFLKGYLQL